MLDPATEACYRELATWAARRAHGAGCPVIGICGAQGSGKSTAAAFLRDALAAAHGLNAAVLSLDDFYLSRTARRDLAARVHPLLTTRGVPGTHEVNLGVATLRQLRALRPGQTLALPRFSKADDDRLPAAEWPRIDGPIDLILFEGWCVGLSPQDDADLADPVNALESDEDPDGRWRRWVNAQLGASYASWFAELEARVFLQVPDFDCVRLWRWQQEQDTARGAAPSAAGLQSFVQLDRFIQHYERLTRHALRVMPARSEAVLHLRDDHRVGDCRIPRR